MGMSEAAQSGLGKIRFNHDAVGEQILMPVDLQIGGEAVSSPIFFANLVPIANGKLIFLGEPGTAKTTLGQAISYSTCKDPTKMKVPCSETMTVESDFVTIDPGKLISQIQIKQKAAGIEIEKIDPAKLDIPTINTLCNKYKIDMASVVEPRPWLADFGCVVIDEVARSAERYQNMFLDILQFKRFKYYGLDIQRPTSMVIATTNWPGKKTDENSMVEAGTHRLVEAFLNRFDIATVVPFPDYYNRGHIQDNIRAGLESSGRMSSDFEYSRLQVLSQKEIEAVQKAASQIPIEDSALHLINIAAIAMDACKHGEGSKGTYWMGFDPGKCLECSNYTPPAGQKPNPCSYFYLPLGPRVDQAIISWSKAAALLLGHDEVDNGLTEAIIPYVIQARAKPTNHFAEDARTAGSMRAYVKQYLDVVNSWTDANSETTMKILESKALQELANVQATYKTVLDNDPIMNAVYTSQKNALTKKLSFKGGSYAKH